MISENILERRLTREIRALGALCIKLTSPGFVGVPDRLVLLPGGVCVFVELKAPGKTERPRQVYVQRVLHGLGFTVFGSVDSLEKIAEVVSACRGLMERAGCRIAEQKPNRPD